MEESRVCAKVNKGLDSFIRVTSILRRKEFKIKSLSMTANEGCYANLDIILENGHYGVEQMVNQISKLIDVKEIEVFKGEM